AYNRFETEELKKKRNDLDRLLPRSLKHNEASSIKELGDITEEVLEESKYLSKQSITYAIDYLKYLFSWDLHSSIFPFIREVVSGKMKLRDWVCR
ncbi:MAG: hypothetical protein AAGA66_14285, partial [Bacteroidota bacterium]